MNLAGGLLADANHDGTPDGRVAWADRMTAEQAANYTVENIFGPSALVETVASGNYTAIVRGEGNTTGVGLVEAYHLQ